MIDVMSFPVEVLLGPCPRYLSQGRPHALQSLLKPYFPTRIISVKGRGSGVVLWWQHTIAPSERVTSCC